MKIDKSFTSAIGIDSVNATVTDMIIALAHRLKIVTVAEGVETRDQEEYLRGNGVDLLQGFYYARYDAGRGLSAVAGGGKASGAERLKMPGGPRADGHQPLLFFVVILSQLDDAYQIDAIVVGFNNRELQR